MITLELTPKEAITHLMQARLLAKRAKVAAQSAIEYLEEAETSLKIAERFVMPLLDNPEPLPPGNQDLSTEVQ